MLPRLDPNLLGQVPCCRSLPPLRRWLPKRLGVWVPCRCCTIGAASPAATAKYRDILPAAATAITNAATATTTTITTAAIPTIVTVAAADATKTPTTDACSHGKRPCNESRI